MKQAVRIAIAGVGLVGKRHATALAQLHDAELSAVVDPSEAGHGFATEAGVPCYASLSEMFAAQAVDGVVLSTPTPLHVEQGLECIRNGCPVLVEKPLAVSASEGRQLVVAAEAAGVAMLVGHHRRYNPLIQKAHEVISGGGIGAVRSVHASCWFYKPDQYFDIAPWRKQTGAGPISVNLVHDVDLIRYLCGEVISVQGQSAPSRRGYENEDVAAAVLGFANGAIGTITVSDSIVSPWSWEMTAGENPAYARTQESCYMIGGSRGSLSVPDLRQWTHQGENRDWFTALSTTVQPRSFSDPLVNQITHFAEVIRRDAQPLVTGKEGLRTLEVVEAIQKACGIGGVVHIDQDEMPVAELERSATG